MIMGGRHRNVAGANAVAFPRVAVIFALPTQSIVFMVAHSMRDRQGPGRKQKHEN